ncbi:MAG: adenosylcobinamide-phosphate synthase CbiB [Methyloceanibacter sp.]|nr:adenosylcobinamide-phosphate synthase CbiB [Methyloceanibacter sp.]
MAAPLALLAMLVELAVGYPQHIVHRIGHPVTWMGRLIARLDTRLNDPALGRSGRRRAGRNALLILLLVVGACAFALETALLLLPFGLLFVALAASALIAQRSLYGHVAAVAEALETGTLDDGRVAVSQIVGRDTRQLDESGVARAAIESLAENFSDGVVSPVLWLGLTGLTGGAVYKAINTADSMIGHRSARHEDFGRAAARLDDVANLPGARLSALLLVGAAAITPGASAQAAWDTTWRDAAKHASPNAGYPEAAMAGAIGVALGGPRRYAGSETDGPWLGNGRRSADANDIRAALALYARADGLLIALLGLAAAASVLL